MPLSHTQVSGEPVVSPVPDLDLSRAESDCCWNSSGTLAPPSWPIDLDVLQVWYSWELQTIHPINLKYVWPCFIHKLLFAAQWATHGHLALESASSLLAPAHINSPFETIKQSPEDAACDVVQAVHRWNMSCFIFFLFHSDIWWDNILTFRKTLSFVEDVD